MGNLDRLPCFYVQILLTSVKYYSRKYQCFVILLKFLLLTFGKSAENRKCSVVSFLKNFSASYSPEGTILARRRVKSCLDLASPKFDFSEISTFFGKFSKTA